MLINLTKMIGAKLKNLMGTEKFTHQTFTYFIPAPPERKTGYREKHFDKLLFEFTKKGYEIVSINTESMDGETKGLWVIIQLKTNKTDAELDLQFPELISEIDGEQDDQNEIEGLYYID